MGAPKKIQEKKEKSVVAQGFIDIKSYEEIAEFAERRGEIIVNQSRRIDGLVADNKGLSEKLVACQNNDQVIIKDLKELISKMEYSFVRGAEELGEITIEDVKYNLQLINRIITKKYGRK